MDITTLTLTAASLVAKRFLSAATDETGDAAWKALKRVAGRIRDLLAQQGDTDAIEAYERVEDSPDSAMSTKALADALKTACQRNSLLEQQLQEIVEAVSQLDLDADFVIEQTGDGSTAYGVVGGNVTNTNNFVAVDAPVQGTPGQPACPKCTSTDVKRKRVFYAAGNTHVCRRCNHRF